ncbi:hypothetical protein SLEP1_g44939 [Rubroshorea leprosula]|uniref:Uncharacterized protein n=1 Tax=Rubroshorea leprosula TaxID=152421 RepID=A0AAV5LI53_9ROSI|nr:hypothetical protein SLEP1_g44939 [Rubroshorea leprosula]
MASIGPGLPMGTTLFAEPPAGGPKSYAERPSPSFRLLHESEQPSVITAPVKAKPKLEPRAERNEASLSDFSFEIAKIAVAHVCKPVDQQSRSQTLTNAVHDLSAVLGGFIGASALHTDNSSLKSSVLKDLSDFWTKAAGGSVEERNGSNGGKLVKDRARVKFRIEG